MVCEVCSFSSPGTFAASLLAWSIFCIRRGGPVRPRANPTSHNCLPANLTLLALVLFVTHRRKPCGSTEGDGQVSHLVLLVRVGAVPVLHARLYSGYIAGRGVQGAFTPLLHSPLTFQEVERLLAGMGVPVAA